MKKILIAVLCIFILLTFFSCNENTLKNKLEKIEIGSDRDDVLKILGSSTTDYQEKNFDDISYLTWEDNNLNGAATVIFNDGKVTDKYWRDGDIWEQEKTLLDEINKKYDTGITYDVINSNIYIRDEKECIGYRVVVNSDIAMTSLFKVFVETTYEDGYYLHTVWFFNDISEIEQATGYTIAMIEEINENGNLNTEYNNEYQAKAINAIRNQEAEEKEIMDSIRRKP